MGRERDAEPARATTMSSLGLPRNVHAWPLAVLERDDFDPRVRPAGSSPGELACGDTDEHDRERAVARRGDLHHKIVLDAGTKFGVRSEKMRRACDEEQRGWGGGVWGRRTLLGESVVTRGRLNRPLGR